jgi:hypothetical protein
MTSITARPTPPDPSMKTDTEMVATTIDELTQQWRDGLISPNTEYQRGQQWRPEQQQMLVDSIFRGYPLPKLYFQEKTTPGLRGQTQIKRDVIDGLQRILSLHRFRQDKYQLLPHDKLDLPETVKQQPCPWADKRFSQLSDELQSQFLGTELQMAIITEATGDEVRDLFIRLQDGTPLSTQQKRDAWPGAIAPYIERLAGKMTTRGQFDRLFAAVDQRGSGAGQAADDEREAIDPYTNARQLCAQLLVLFLDADAGKRDMPSLTSQALDRLYHEQTAFESPRRERFEELLRACQSIVVDRRPTQARAKRNRVVVKKNRLFSLLLLLHRLRAAAPAQISLEDLSQVVAHEFWKQLPATTEPEPTGRVTSSSMIQDHFRWFVEVQMANLQVPYRDSQRLFSDEQKAQIRAASQGACGICEVPLGDEAAEYDHIVPYRLGGKTQVSNGRVVHARCHKRGLAALEAALATGAA